MAASWIKMRTDLLNDPRVIEMARNMRVGRQHVIGCLYLLWSLADEYAVPRECPPVDMSTLSTGDTGGTCPRMSPSMSPSIEGHLAHYHSEDLDRVIEQPGFTAALVAINWLVIHTDGIGFPDWEKYHASSSKTRDYETRKKARYRARKAGKPSTDRTFRASNVPGGQGGHVPGGQGGQCPPLEKRREDIRDESLTPSCSEAARPPSEPPLRQTSLMDDPVLLVFPVAGPQECKEWGLTASFVAVLREAFPAVDVLAQAKRALAWTIANPKKRKTPGGMRSFLNTWLGKAQNEACKYNATVAATAPYQPSNSGKAILEQDRLRKEGIKP